MYYIEELNSKLKQLVASSIQDSTVQNKLYRLWLTNPGLFKQLNSRTGKINSKSFFKTGSKLVACFTDFPKLDADKKVSRLVKINLHPRVLLATPISLTIKYKFKKLYQEVADLREDLVLKSELIIKNMTDSKHLYSSFVDKEDVSQWAWEKAWIATLQYDPKKGGWEKYLVYTLKRGLYKEIAENSRLVSLPRWVLSRWSPIGRISEESSEIVAKLANIRATSAVAKKKLYTEGEVDSLKSIVNISYDDIDNCNIVGHTIQPAIDVKMLRSNIIEEAQKILNAEELKCLEYRLESLKRNQIVTRMKELDESFNLKKLDKFNINITEKLKQSDKLKKIMEFIKEEE